MKHSTSRRFLLATIAVLVSQLIFGQKDMVREPDTKRPVTFAAFSDTLSFQAENTNYLVSRNKSEHVSVMLSPGFLFEGTILSKRSIDATRTAIIIRSTNYDGYMLSLFQHLQSDGSRVFSGHLVSMRHGDAFVLQFSQGNYKWVKKGFYDLVNE
ncbi:MAG: hypothetical protein JNM88_12520 [Chitinophagaceae bacterium]|nr:hypothetical protein [Chitinophagaceae bacterium]